MKTNGFTAYVKNPPPSFTPLRASAHIFAEQAGYGGYDIKVIGSKEAIFQNVPAWDVFVRAPGASRGRCIGAMLASACAPFGPYRN